MQRGLPHKVIHSLCKELILNACVCFEPIKWMFLHTRAQHSRAFWTAWNAAPFFSAWLALGLLEWNGFSSTSISNLSLNKSNTLQQPNASEAVELRVWLMLWIGLKTQKPSHTCTHFKMQVYLFQTTHSHASEPFTCCTSHFHVHAA